MKFLFMFGLIVLLFSPVGILLMLMIDVIFFLYGGRLNPMIIMGNVIALMGLASRANE